MNPVPLTPYVSYDPTDFILPIRTERQSASLPPTLVEWWQWVPAKSATQRPQWVRVKVTSDLSA